MELAFAGLHQLCAPILDGLDGSPGPQRDALRVAFGLQDGAAPNSFLVALAALSLLAEAAEVGPLVCLVDDAQWLDRARRRRLRSWRGVCWRSGSPWCSPSASPTTRWSSPACRSWWSRGSPTRTLAGCWRRRCPAAGRPRARSDRRRDAWQPPRVVGAAAWVEPAALAGGFGLPDARPLASRVEETFVQRVRALPRDTQPLPLMAAAEPVGDVSLLSASASRVNQIAGRRCLPGAP